MIAQDQHQVEIEKNLQSWRVKPLLQSIYAGFYDRIAATVDANLAGAIVEIGSGIGNLKSRIPRAVCTDLFPNPWLDLVCDGYELPFADSALSHLVLFDVFHHLQIPRAFLREAQRVLVPGGRLILFEPYISLSSFPVFGLAHHEPVAWRSAIDWSDGLPPNRSYYAAQGNATRVFFRRENPWALDGWRIARAEAFSAFDYLLSGGYSKPALYPAGWLPRLRRLDALLSRWPKLFGSRCLVVLISEAG